MVTEKQPTKTEALLKWEVQKRLEFIELRLFWDGRVNRGCLVEQFGISGVQATADLSKYTKMAPHNLCYDSKEKTYIVGSDFEPVFSQPEPEEFLSKLQKNNFYYLSSALSVGTLQLPARKINVSILRKIVFAIREKVSLEIQYQSMSKPTPNWRLFSPHSFAFDGLRWHIRAFCFADNIFKDFLLARIVAIGQKRPGVMFMEDDHKWNSFVEILLTPHPKLSEGQKAVIETDYCMTNGVVRLKVRQALLPYLLQRLNLVEERKQPEEQQIVLKNKKKILEIGTF